MTLATGKGAPLDKPPSLVAPTPTIPAVWQCIEYRESSNNIHAVNPESGDQGAFQFSLDTWRQYAPVGFPSEPIEATLDQQYEVALILWKARGFEPWETAPLCGV